MKKIKIITGAVKDLKEIQDKAEKFLNEGHYISVIATESMNSGIWSYTLTIIIEVKQ